MEIRVDIDDAAFRAGLDRIKRAAHDEGKKASMEVARDIQADARARVPKRTGALMASIEASQDGDGAVVGPTDSARSFNGPYGRAVELGGMRHAHNPSGRMWWTDGSGQHSAVANMMPSQPYLKPAADHIVESGTAEHIFEDHWRRAMEA